MDFYISKRHKRNAKLKLIGIGLFIIILQLGSIWLAIHKETLMAQIKAGFCAIFLGYFLLISYEKIKNYDASCVMVSILESENKINFISQGNIISLSFSEIDSLRVQLIHSKIKSILLKTQRLGLIRLEGYEHLTEMAEILKKYTPTEKIKMASWFHH